MGFRILTLWDWPLTASVSGLGRTHFLRDAIWRWDVGEEVRGKGNYSVPARSDRKCLDRWITSIEVKTGRWGQGFTFCVYSVNRMSPELKRDLVTQINMPREMNAGSFEVVGPASAFPKKEERAWRSYHATRCVAPSNVFPSSKGSQSVPRTEWCINVANRLCMLLALECLLISRTLYHLPNDLSKDRRQSSYRSSLTPPPNKELSEPLSTCSFLWILSCTVIMWRLRCYRAPTDTPTEWSKPILSTLQRAVCICSHSGDLAPTQPAARSGRWPGG